METKTNRTIKVCQIGAGLIGRERIAALTSLSKLGRKIELGVVCDPYLKETPDILKKNGLRLVKSDRGDFFLHAGLDIYFHPA